MKTQPQPETVGQRDLFLDRLAGMDGGRALVVDHVARHQVAPVRGRIEDHIVRPPGQPAIQHRLQRFVLRIVMAEGQVVGEQHETLVFGVTQNRQQPTDTVQILARDLDQHQRQALRACLGMGGLHQAGLAHPARTPEQRIIRRMAARELQRIGQQRVAGAVDADQLGQIDPVDLGHGFQPVGIGVPDIGIGLGEAGRGCGRRGQTLQRRGNAGQGRVIHRPAGPVRAIPRSGGARSGGQAGSRSRKARKPR